MSKFGCVSAVDASIMALGLHKYFCNFAVLKNGKFTSWYQYIIWQEFC